MTVEQTVSVIQAVASLVAALVWPALLVFLVLRFGKPILGLLQDDKAEETRLKASFAGVGVELGVKRKLDAVAALTAAAVTREAGTGQSPTVDKEQLSEIVDTVSQAGNVASNRQGGRRSILWVDDMPSNNYFEQETLRALGIRIVTSLSTAEALDRLKTDHFDLVISDFSRPGDPQAGYTLLAQLRDLSYNMPYIIYAGSNSAEHRAAARQRGAQGSTNDPRELVQLVLNALQTVA